MKPTDKELLEMALYVIRDLLSSCELNMDDMEQETLISIQRAARFENKAAQAGHVPVLHPHLE